MKYIGIVLFIVGALSQGCGFMVNCVSYGSKKSVMEKVDGWYVVIKTDTQWSGTLGNRTVDGRGNSQVNLPENPIWAACVVQKQCKKRYLTIQILHTDGRESEPITTTAAFGVVTLMPPTSQPPVDQ